ncbi:alpha/beta hydrolase [uncultured Ruminococcus sp.]|uniref:alpha/beta hydrolase n=1 Tax=uncultured Ruminococcus sp. TaxID=165186 RepID=UPI00261511BE|nr:alpha/beta hydrolase-fold protein [uncultured Ruminococcus sp.]
MKRVIAILLSLTLLTSMSACSNSENSSLSTQVKTSESVENTEPIHLTNKMTETELAKVDKHSLTLLDAPEETTNTTTEQSGHTVRIEFASIPIDKIITGLEAAKEELTDEEYGKLYEKFDSYIESSEDYTYPKYIFVDDQNIFDNAPLMPPTYDDGKITVTDTKYNSETDSYETTTNTYADMDDYLDWIRCKFRDWNYPEEEIEKIEERILIADEAYRDSNYETLPEGSVVYSESDYSYIISTDENKDYRNEWEFDRQAVEDIKDSIDEIDIYDEELDKAFVVHVTLPPEYDNKKEYPVILLTDGIWRFGNTPEMRKVMEDGKAAPVILVSIWYSYDVEDTSGSKRYNDLVLERSKSLDFITDNLMPYLGENYSIDYKNSTLYGHSDGGVFSHYALFNSDLYENQPFGNYIIGSPAFWGLYYDYPDLNPEEYEKDYGYFDRNEKLSKSVFLCAGSQEDPDYTDSYNGHDTTLEGVAKLKERLESHGANLTYKLYDSHHYQYVPSMLLEYLKAEYPVQ